MSVAAILGAGSLGGAIAHRLAERARFREVRLIDEQGADAAAGKALDLRQTGPIGGFDTRVTADGDLLAAAGATVIIVADAVETGEWQGEAGLAMIRRLIGAGTSAPIVFAGPSQTWLMEAAAAELKVPGDRLIGTAPAALVGAARALASLELKGSPADVNLTLTGRPPRFAVAWATATAAGLPLADRVPAHRLLAITEALRSLWPPGPQAIGAVTARIAEGLAFGSRRRFTAMSIPDASQGERGVALMLPVELGDGRVRGTGLFSTDPA
jgi:malate dehydrogenase